MFLDASCGEISYGDGAVGSPGVCMSMCVRARARACVCVRARAGTVLAMCGSTGSAGLHCTGWFSWRFCRQVFFLQFYLPGHCFLRVSSQDTAPAWGYCIHSRWHSPRRQEKFQLQSYKLQVIFVFSLIFAKGF